MFPAIYHPFNYVIVLWIIFSLMFEHGRTEESFECRSEFIPPGSTESVKITCCSKIKLGDNDKLFWRKYDETLGTCIPGSSEVRDYACYVSHSSSDRYRIETCGPNCFAFGIVQLLNETDYGEYYLTLSEGFVVVLARELVLNLTALGPDIEHVVTMSSPSLGNTTAPSFPLSMSCPYSEHVSSSSRQSPTVLAPENATESSSTNMTNEYTRSSHITSEETTLAIERYHSNKITDITSSRSVEVTNDDSKNIITILSILVVLAFLFGLVMCLYIIICKIRKFREGNLLKQSKNGPNRKTNDCAEIEYENPDIVHSFHSRPKSKSPTDHNEGESSCAILVPGIQTCGDRTSDDENDMVKIYQEDKKVIPEIALEHAYLTMDDVIVSQRDSESEWSKLSTKNGSPKENEFVTSRRGIEAPEVSDMLENAYCTRIERCAVMEGDLDECKIEGQVGLQHLYFTGDDVIVNHNGDKISPKYESIL